MIRLFKKIYLTFKPIKSNDVMYGYTKNLLSDESVKNLKRTVTIKIIESENSFLKVEYFYYGKGGRMVSGTSYMARNKLNDHYINGRIAFA